MYHKGRIKLYIPPEVPSQKRELPIVKGEELRTREYEVEAVVDHCDDNGQMFYLVKWAGYDEEENTWEPEENLENAKKLINTYWRQGRLHREGGQHVRTYVQVVTGRPCAPAWPLAYGVTTNADDTNKDQIKEGAAITEIADGHIRTAQERLSTLREKCSGNPDIFVGRWGSTEEAEWWDDKASLLYVEFRWYGLADSGMSMAVQILPPAMGRHSICKLAVDIKPCLATHFTDIKLL